MSVRVYSSQYHFHNYLELKRGNLFRSAYPSKYDKGLGWIPKEGNHPKNVWNTSVTILKDGIRSNQNVLSKKNQKIILAVGDSFTFGDQVSDDETWPAILEDISDSRVINGGVFGYGIDQSFLRMQELTPKYRPDSIIFSFIPDDINRCELSERTSVPKPYFDISKNGDLVLMEDHIQPKIHSSEIPLNPVQKIMGYSFIFHKLASKFIPAYWFQGSWESTKAHSKGAEVTCRIFNSLNHFAQKEEVKIFILVQYEKDEFEKDVGIVKEAINCIDQNLIKIVNLHTSLAKIKDKDINKYRSFFHGHMTKAGNAFVASVLWKAISEHQKMPNNGDK